MNFSHITPYHKKLVFLITLLTLSTIIAITRMDSWIDGYFFDDANYIINAESLAAGQGQRLINYPGTPVEPFFPIGWPLLLTPISIFYSGNYLVLRIIPLAFWLATVPLIYMLFSKRLDWPFREIFITLIALNPILIAYSGMLMAEISFIFFTYLACYLLENSDSRKAFFIGALFCAIYSWQIRAVGLTLFPAILIYLGWKRNYKKMIIAAIIFAAVFFVNSMANSSLGRALVNYQFETSLEMSNSSLIETQIEHIVSNVGGWLIMNWLTRLYRYLARKFRLRSSSQD